MFQQNIMLGESWLKIEQYLEYQATEIISHIERYSHANWKSTDK